MKRYPLLTTFRVYPESAHPDEKRPPHSRYFEVRVYRDKPAMRRGIRGHACTKAGDYRQTGALAHACRTILVTKGQPERERPQRGILFIHEGEVFSEQVAHEMGHFALRIATDDRVFVQRKSAIGVASLEEESFCYILGRLVSQFWSGWGVYERTHPKRTTR